MGVAAMGLCYFHAINTIADFKPVRKKKQDGRRHSRHPTSPESAALMSSRGVSLSAFAHSAIERGGGEPGSEIKSSSRRSGKLTKKRKLG